MVNVELSSITPTVNSDSKSLKFQSTDDRNVFYNIQKKMIMLSKRQVLQRPVNIFMVFVTIFALFGDDIRIAGTIYNFTYSLQS